MLKDIIIIRTILWLSLAIFVAWLMWQVVVPSGRVAYLTDKHHQSGFIGDFEPLGSLAKVDGQTKIIGNSVYFTVRTPRPFSKLKLTLSYRPSDQSLIELGLLQNGDQENYQVKPLYHQVINNLYHAKDWGVIENGQTLFLQRQDVYDSLKQFLAKPPAASEVAIYNYKWPSQGVKKLGEDKILDKQINYVVANYQPPTILADGYYESQVEFDLASAKQERGVYKLKLIVPGLEYNDSQLGSISIASIQAEFSGKTWREFFKL